MNVGTTIALQLGGMKFMVMTGAKDFVNLPDGVQFRLPAGFAKPAGINMIRIRLTAMDDYKLEFAKFRGVNYRVVREFEHVYDDQLQAIFTSVTGLDTNL